MFSVVVGGGRHYQHVVSDLPEREYNATSWRELVSPSNPRLKYYFNTVTKVTTYDMPPEYREYLVRRGRAHSSGKLSKEQMEEIFFNVLRERGVRSGWSWEEALRAIIDHPEYKVLPTLMERKTAFQHFQRVQEEAEREERRMQSSIIRQRFKQLLGTTLTSRKMNITGDTWYQLSSILKDHPDFKAITSEREQWDLYEEFCVEKRRADAVTKPKITIFAISYYFFDLLVFGCV